MSRHKVHRLPYLIQKPWGKEQIMVLNKAYMIKFLTINPGMGAKYMHFHEHKTETFLIKEGELTLELEGRILTLKPSDHKFVTINPGQKHRLSSGPGCVVIEVSTPYLNDTVRIDGGEKHDTNKV